MGAVVSGKFLCYNVREQKTKRRRMRHLVFAAKTSKQSAKQTSESESAGLQVLGARGKTMGLAKRAVSAKKAFRPEEELL